MKFWMAIFLPSLMMVQMVLAESAEPVKPVISGIEVRAVRCKTGCAAGKFKFTLLVFNNTGQKFRIDKNDLKYKLRISYKPGDAKKGKKAPSQPYKTIAFMQASGSTEEWTELEANDFIGIRKEIDLGEFDKGLCASPAITIYGTVHVIGNNSNPELEINQKIAGNCAI